MKKLNKKGFTIVELVIVISVIAILSAVMVPTFAGVVNRAKESAADQSASATYNALLAYGELDNITCDGYVLVVDNEYYYEVSDGKLVDIKATDVNLAANYTLVEPDDANEFIAEVYKPKA